MKRNKNRGFTLIELLVVIAIMGVLAALLVPALSTTRERAKGVGCASNLRQHGVAIEMYADEHDGAIPRVTQLVRYLDDPNVFVCPKDERNEAMFGEVEIFPEEERFKHSYSTHIATPPSNRQGDVNGVYSEQVVLVESNQAGIEAPGDITLEDVTTRHNPFTYVLHLGGHVQGYTEDQMAAVFQCFPREDVEEPLDPGS